MNWSYFFIYKDLICGSVRSFYFCLLALGFTPSGKQHHRVSMVTNAESSKCSYFRRRTIIERRSGEKTYFLPSCFLREIPWKSFYGLKRTKTFFRSSFDGARSRNFWVNSPQLNARFKHGKSVKTFRIFDKRFSGALSRKAFKSSLDDHPQISSMTARRLRFTSIATLINNSNFSIFYVAEP